ncbi:DNA methyltransferase [Subtercola boreus]|uniref:DNA (cytosine-5-)-methyltransferase n=1 Tax=Subtercola boreus TaxID=120213 RepID=A0A3E0VR99_9MICO|nr:DNA cytosine methyltransferase [Subtercola boreus]RFA12129.1 DNA methyltransferase [Subtercola boreus]
MTTATTLERPQVTPTRAGYTQPTVPWNGLTATDLFCGAGGSSSGLVAAGYKVVIAANHWKLAIDSHQINHPDTDHSSADISQVDPRFFPRTDLLWGSPECTNHSGAKGIKRQRTENEALFNLDGTAPLPDAAAERSRATMWDIPRFAEFHQYRAIIIENVVEAYRWVQFPAWLMAMESLGYEHEIAWVNSMHAQMLGDPAPQSRDRIYIVFWRKGERKPNIQKWTSPRALCATHGVIRAVQTFKKAERWGRYRAQYVFRCPQCAAIVEPAWLPASSAIDFSIRGTRIGDRKTPLSPKTMTRIGKGIDKYWRPIVVEAAGNTYDSADPKHQQFGSPTGYLRAWPTEEAFRTLHTTSSKGFALPPLITDGIRGEGTVQSASAAMNTQTTAQTKGVFYDPLMIPVEGRDGKTAQSSSEPMRTQSTRNETGIVIPLRNHGVAKSVSEPIDTVSAGGNHHALLMRNNTGGAEMTTPASEVMRTLTTGGHQSLLVNNVSGADASRSKPVSDPLPSMVAGGLHASLLVPYYGNSTPSPVTEPVGTLTTHDRYSLLSGSVDVEDCEFRMLEPDEVKVGMGFARDYLLMGTKREQVKQSGNAVTPPNARDIGACVAEALTGEIVEMAA